MRHVSAGALVLCFGLLGCNFNDDEPLDPTIGGTGGDTDGGPNSQAECLDHATAIGVECDMGQSFWFDWNGPDYNMTLIDDPAASVGVGPNAWLLQASTSADWIGDYEGSAGDCNFGCAWCPPGQSVCHGGFDESGFPTCYLCLPVEDTPAGITAAGNACATFVAGNQACLGGLPPGGGGGDGGTTSGGGDSGVDSTGAGAEYDCNLWDVSSAASVNQTKKQITIEEATLEEVVQHFGAPLTDCDGVRFSQDNDGYFVLSKLPNKSTSLLGKMGLELGDRIETINGEKIQSADAVADKVMDLFYSGGEPAKNFTLGVRRFGRTTTFTEYKVVAEPLPE